MPSTMKLDASRMAFLSDGSLIAATEDSLVRVDVDRMKVVAKRKASWPVFAVSPRGALFFAEKNSVVACDPSTLSTLGPVGMPAGRGRDAVYLELAVSPTGEHLAGATEETFHVLHVESKKLVRSSPSYGAKREHIGFVSESVLCAIRAGVVQVEPIESDRPTQIATTSFGVAGDGYFVGWDHAANVSIIDVSSGQSGTVRRPSDDDGCQVALVAGEARAVVSSGSTLLLVDLKKRKVLSKVPRRSPAVLAVSRGRVALCVDETLEVLSLDQLAS
ncbi:MAG: hypothetical protein U0269_28815 [Polyangiales bacterium]